MEPNIEVIDRRGVEDYSTTLGLQQDLLQQKIADRTLPDYLILVEHAEVYTVGRGAPVQTLIQSTEKSVPWIEVGRGGDATFHGPGQVVCYPIFDLERYGNDVHRYLRKLEAAIIAMLRDFHIEGITRKGFTGVWVNHAEEMKKIASIGIGVKRWIAYHGIAVNVTTDLRYFQAISPCGQDGRVMTSMEEVTRKRLQLGTAAVKSSLVSAFRREFRAPRPAWLKVKAPGSPEFIETQTIVKNLKLVTVCEEARCPNIGECWSHHTATFMIMGELCTRRCGFCSVKDGTVANLQQLDALEPYRIARAVAELGLLHVVVTSVNRDDLSDMGAGHFNATARAIRKWNPECSIEFLIPDMQGRRELLEQILCDVDVSILNHNIETVPRLYRRVRPGASFKRSLEILRWAHEISSGVRTKSGLMVGLGETKGEVLEVMDALREAGCDILTIGQYLQPTKNQLPIAEYVTPEQFREYEEEGKRRGFSFVESGPFVRSSYHAWKHSNTATHLSAGSGRTPSPSTSVHP